MSLISTPQRALGRKIEKKKKIIKEEEKVGKAYNRSWVTCGPSPFPVSPALFGNNQRWLGKVAKTREDYLESSLLIFLGCFPMESG